MSYRKLFKYSSFVATPFIWYYIGTRDRDTIRRNMYNHGLNVSQKFKKYPVWDNCVEPFIIRQCLILFTAGNSFIKGMISDNKNKFIVDREFDNLKKEIVKELNDE